MKGFPRKDPCDCKGLHGLTFEGFAWDMRNTYENDVQAYMSLLCSLRPVHNINKKVLRSQGVVIMRSKTSLQSTKSGGGEHFCYLITGQKLAQRVVFHRHLHLCCDARLAYGEFT